MAKNQNASMVNQADLPNPMPKTSHRRAMPRARNAAATPNGHRRSARSPHRVAHSSASPTRTHTRNSTNHNRPAVMLSSGPRNLLASNTFEAA